PVAIALLVVCGGIGLYWLIGDTEGGSVGAELEDTPDPWDERVPEELATAHEQIESGEPMDEDTTSSVRAYAWANEDDPRPYLLEGHSLFAKKRRVMAIARYTRAYEIDPGARGDPRMLENLIRLAASSNTNEPASNAIEDIYGEEAVPAIEHALESPGSLPSGGGARLRQLRDQLSG
ncbi:MAG: hypothetical protein ACOCUS_05170, partial [Polyangiales bacterium]